MAGSGSGHVQRQSRFRKMYFLAALIAFVVVLFIFSESLFSFRPTVRVDNVEPRSNETPLPNSVSVMKNSVKPGHSGYSAEPGHSDRTEPGQPSHSDRTEPGHSDRTEPGHSDRTEPGHSGSAEPGHSDRTEPGHSDSAEPGHSDSAEPSHSDRTEPGHSDSAEPGHSDSAEPGHSDNTAGENQVSPQPSCNFLPSDSSAPLCPLCSTPTENITEVSVYLHDFDHVNIFWAGNEQFIQYEDQSSSCVLSSGVKCVINHNNQQSDGIVLFTRSNLPSNGPLRYCYPQVIILFNTEVEHPGYDSGYKPYTEVMYDYHLKSDIRYIYPCSSLHIKDESQPPKPEEHSGFAMFISNCGAAERLNYVTQLKRFIDIDSYGNCLHNMDRASDRYVADWPGMERDVLSKYRLAIAYENTISPEYITEKAFHALSVGAIPVYRGPPEIYSHIPDRHNIINIDDYASPEELAKYLQRILDEDELYLHHATLNMTKVEEYKRTVCSDGPVGCQMCEKVYQLKVASLAGGSRPCSCAHALHTNQ